MAAQASVIQAEPTQVRLTVYLPGDLSERVRLHAAVANITRSQVVVDCLTKGLAEIRIQHIDPDEAKSPTLATKEETRGKGRGGKRDV